MRVTIKCARQPMRAGNRRRRATLCKSVRARKRPLQREVLRDVMLSAGECATWLTLAELGRITSYPPASISAQLRHLRKPRHGGFRLEKRCRHAAKTRFAAVAGETPPHGPVWEYRLRRQPNVTAGERLSRRGAAWA